MYPLKRKQRRNNKNAEIFTKIGNNIEKLKNNDRTKYTQDATKLSYKTTGKQQKNTH